MKRILMILIFVFNIIIISDFAYADDVLPNFYDYIVKDDGTQKYYAISSEDYHESSFNTKYYLYVFSGDAPRGFYLSTNSYVGHQLSYLDYCAVYTYTVGVDEIWQFQQGGTDGVISVRLGYPLEDKKGRTFHYSNFDVYDGDNTKVFHKALSLSGAIIPRMKVLTLALSSIVYIVPCLISLVVLAIAFRKAWNWLLIQLST